VEINNKRKFKNLEIFKKIYKKGKQESKELENFSKIEILDDEILKITKQKIFRKV